jgi:hypothetical protein
MDRPTPSLPMLTPPSVKLLKYLSTAKGGHKNMSRI